MNRLGHAGILPLVGMQVVTSTKEHQSRDHILLNDSFSLQLKRELDLPVYCT